MKRFQVDGKASAIDIDLLAQLAKDESQLGRLENIINKFRRCPNTVYALPSTQHAVMRVFFENQQTDTLMRMIDDCLSYGLFPDYYLCNLLMDMFIKKGNYRDAVKVAVQLMLQEEYENPISNSLSLFSCYSYLRKPQPDPWDPQPRPKPEEPTEVVKVRVDYLREPYFDDHFDLTNPQHLIGKTLVCLGKQYEGLLGNTSVLLGWTMFEKYDKAMEFLEGLPVSDEPLLFKEWAQHSQTLIPQGLADKFSSILQSLEAQGSLQEGDILEPIRRMTEEIVLKNQKMEIERQTASYVQWEERRQNEMESQIRELDRRRRLSLLETKKKELEEREQQLYFFDNLDQWELRFEEKEEVRREREQRMSSQGKKVNAKLLRQAEEDSYVPPEVYKKRAE